MMPHNPEEWAEAPPAEVTPFSTGGNPAAQPMSFWLLVDMLLLAGYSSVRPEKIRGLFRVPLDDWNALFYGSKLLGIFPVVAEDGTLAAGSAPAPADCILTFLFGYEENWKELAQARLALAIPTLVYAEATSVTYVEALRQLRSSPSTDQEYRDALDKANVARYTWEACLTLEPDDPDLVREE